MNELRNKIIDELRGGQEIANNSDLHDKQVLELLYGQTADAILDAVIAALPEERQKQYILEGGTTNTEEGNQRFYRYGGYDAALNNVKRILQEAKESK